MKWTRVAAIAAVGFAASCGGGGSSYTTSTVGGGGGGGGAGGGGSTISPVMQGTAFSPTPDTVTAGMTVTWTNNDPFTHTVTYASGPDSSFDSGNIPSGGTYQHTFMKAGTYVYYCKIHGTPSSGMRGTIVAK